MQYFQVPNDVKATMTNHCPTCRRAPENGEKVLDLSFCDWLTAFVDDPSLWKKPSDVRIAMKLGRVVTKEAVVPGAVLALEDEDYKKLKGVYESPSFAYHPQVMKQCETFMNVFENPLPKDPREPGA